MKFRCLCSLPVLTSILLMALLIPGAAAQGAASTAGRLAVVLLGDHRPATVVGALPAVASDDDQVQFEALVVDWSGQGVAGVPIRFSMGGTSVLESTTDETGRASFTWAHGELADKLVYQIGDLEPLSIESVPQTEQSALVIVVLGEEGSELVVLESAARPFGLTEASSSRASLRFVFSHALPVRLPGNLVARDGGRFAMTVEGALCGEYFAGHSWRFADASVARRRFNLEGVSFECEVPASSLAAGEASFRFGVVRPGEELPRGKDRSPGFTTDPKLSPTFTVAVQPDHQTTVHIGCNSRVGGFYRWAVTDTWVEPAGSNRLQPRDID